MRVLHLLKTSTGATWALRQMREMVRAGVDVHVALPGGGTLVPAYEAAGIVVHEANFDFPVRDPLRARKLFGECRDLVAQVKPDLVHSHFVGTTLTMRLALGKRSSVPRIFQVPGPLHLEHPLFRGAEIMTAGADDYWIGTCRWTCGRYLASGVGPERVFLSYYGTDLELFAERPRGKLRAELGVGRDTRIVGMVAYLYAPKRYLGQRRGIKGHEDLVDAFALCLRDDPNLVCVFVGGPWQGATGYEGEVRRYAAAKLGAKAVFLGTRHDVSDLYPDFDVAVHPSHSENVGGAVESLLMGVPTIATEVGGFPDLVKQGETGRLVPAGDPRALSKTIAEVLANPEAARAMAENGRRLARSMFDVRRTAAEVHQIYEKVLASRDTGHRGSPRKVA